MQKSLKKAWRIKSFKKNFSMTNLYRQKFQEAFSQIYEDKVLESFIKKKFFYMYSSLNRKIFRMYIWIRSFRTKKLYKKKIRRKALELIVKGKKFQEDL